MTLTEDERRDALAEDAKNAGLADGFTFKPGFDEGSKPTDKSSGAGIFDSAILLNDGIKKDNQALMIAAGVAVVFDGVGMVLNPFGSLLSAGVGWLIDHLFFLREPLDMLMGDNLAIGAQTDRIKAEAKEYIERIAPDHDAAVEKIQLAWKGAADAAFGDDMTKVTDELKALGAVLEGLADLMEKMGACVTAFRSAVRDLIAMTIGGLIAGAIMAVTMMPFTFGTSIAVFIVTAVGVAVAALAKIMTLIGKLTTILSKNADNAAKIGGKADDVAASAGRHGGPKPGGPAPGNQSKPPDPAPSPPPGRPAPPPTKPTTADMTKFSISQRMDVLNKVTDQALADSLIKRLGMSPALAFGYVRTLRNIENVAAPGGVVTIAGKQIRSGDFLHVVHELCKEFANAMARDDD